MDWGLIADIRREQLDARRDVSFWKVFLPMWLRLVRSAAPASIVEIGSGTGHLARELSLETKRYVAIEPSGGMARVAKEVLAETSVHFVESTLADFDGEPNDFEMAAMHMVLQAVPDCETMIRDAINLVAPNGRLVFTIPHPCFSERNHWIPNYRYAEVGKGTGPFTITSDSSNAGIEIPLYHRPLGEYVRSIRKAGGWLIDLIELDPSPSIRAEYSGKWTDPRYVALVIAKDPEVDPVRSPGTAIASLP